MKKITLDSVFEALVKEQYVVRVPEDIRVKARAALDRMLEL
jgi:quinolinate synthase